MKKYQADFHIHTNYSDGNYSVESILEYIYKNTILDIIAITDHDTIDGALKALEIQKYKKYPFKIIIGEEISTIEGHLIGLFLKKPIKQGQPLHQTLLEIQKQNGISIASHPFIQTKQKHNGNEVGGIGLINILKEKDLIDALEVSNGNLIMSFGENQKAKKINQQFLHMPEIGGSDAHILSSIGKSYTILDGNNFINIKNNIKIGNTIACSKKWDFKSIFDYTIHIIPHLFKYLRFRLTKFSNVVFKKITQIYINFRRITINLFGSRLFQPITYQKPDKGSRK